MKLSTVTAKLTGMKSNVVRVLAAATLAGAALTAAAPAAQAQQFNAGFHGGPVMVPYGYDHRFDDRRRFEEERRVEAERRFYFEHRFHNDYRHDWR